MKLMAVVSRDMMDDLPETITRDLGRFIIMMRAEKPDIRDVLAQADLKNTSLEDILGLNQ